MSNIMMLARSKEGRRTRAGHRKAPTQPGGGLSGSRTACLHMCTPSLTASSTHIDPVRSIGTGVQRNQGSQLVASDVREGVWGQGS